MKRIMLLTHGDFAHGIVDSLEVITGQKPDITAIAVTADDAPESIKERVETFLNAASDGDINLILTDIPGGSTTTNAFSYAARAGVYVITGLNLALLLELALNPEDEDIEELIRQSIAVAKKSFLFVNDMLKAKQ